MIDHRQEGSRKDSVRSEEPASAGFLLPRKKRIQHPRPVFNTLLQMAPKCSASIEQAADL